jgi:glycosyltransferase involved in cell wall biosynthesis
MIAVSDFVRKINKQFFIHQVIKRVYNGVDTNEFHPIKKEIAKAFFGLPPSKKVVLFLGRLIYEKGLHILLEAMSMLREKCIVAVVGTGRLYSYYKILAKRYKIEDSTVFLGKLPRHHIKLAYAMADAYIFPSIWPEAGPLTLFEAMASTTPIISTNIGIFPEIIDNYVNGILVKPNDPSQLAEAINQLLQDPDLSRTIVDNGSSYIIDNNLSWEKTASNLLNVYGSLKNS